tara:strand:- start:43 stop:846 length:804 start_codon:yes stop_codon:yes gene_type:complete
MYISIEVFLKQVKKKIFYLIGFMLLVFFALEYLNSTKENHHDVRIKTNFYDARVLYNIIKMADGAIVFDSDTQGSNFIYKFELGISKNLEILDGTNCDFETNILDCEKKNILLVSDEIESLKIKIKKNISEILREIFSSEIKMIQHKINSKEKMYKVLESESKSLDNQESLTTTTSDAGTFQMNNTYINPMKNTIANKQIDNIVKLEQLTFLRDALTKMSVTEQSITNQIEINKSTYGSNNLKFLLGSLAFALVLIFLSIPNSIPRS